MVLDHGYSTNGIEDAIGNAGSYGELKSGRFGQGAFPILLMLTFVATGIWTAGLVSSSSNCYAPESHAAADKPLVNLTYFYTLTFLLNTLPDSVLQKVWVLRRCPPR